MGYLGRLGAHVRCVFIGNDGGDWSQNSVIPYAIALASRFSRVKDAGADDAGDRA